MQTPATDIASQVEADLARPETVLVFPSEIAAAFHRGHYASSRPPRAVENDRLISWDRFKEQSFAMYRSERPANMLVRTVFTRSLLERNSRSPFLRRIVPETAAKDSSAFVSYVRRSLPGVPVLCEDELSRRIDPDLASDAKAVYTAYSAFLDSHGLFEPGWERPRPQALGKRFVLYLPELAEDFALYEALLSQTPGVETRPLAAFRAELPAEEADSSEARGAIHEYPTSADEVRGLCDRVEALLDAGVEASAIAVSVCELESIEPMLRAEAGLREIPLDVRSGNPLSAHSAGRLFSAMSRWVSGGFQLRHFKPVVLDRAVPWRAAPLYRRSIERLVLADESSLRADEEAWTAYRILKAIALEITRASAFSELRDSVNRLLYTLVDPEGWDPDEERALQRSMDLLSDLGDIEGELGLGVEGPFEIYVSALAEQLYVAQGPRAGVRVYPYRVAAGITPAHHFIVNLSQSASRVVTSRAPFLRDDEKRLLGLEDQSFTDVFLDAYALSGGHTSFSYARVSERGAVIPPTSFLKADGVVPASSGTGAPRRFEAERAFFDGGEVFGDLYRSQLRSFRSAKRLGIYTASPVGSRPARLTRAPISRPELLRAVEEQVSSRDLPGFLGLSESRLRTLIACPLRFLFEQALGAAEPEYEKRYDDARGLGNLYHAALQRYYAGLAADTLRPGDLDSNSRETRLRAAFDEAAEAVRNRADGLSVDVLELIRPSMLEDLGRIIELDVERAGSLRVVATEKRYLREFPEDRVVLSGKIDRLSAGESRVLIVDYKRSDLPKPKDLRRASDALSADPDGETLWGSSVQLQMPVYAVLGRSSGWEASEGAFYSIRNGNVRSAFGEGAEKLPDSSLATAAMLVQKIVELAARRIRSGDFRPPEEDAGCESCELRRVCRTRFAVRSDS